MFNFNGNGIPTVADVVEQLDINFDPDDDETLAFEEFTGGAKVTVTPSAPVTLSELRGAADRLAEIFLQYNRYYAGIDSARSDAYGDCYNMLGSIIDPAISSFGSASALASLEADANKATQGKVDAATVKG